MRQMTAIVLAAGLSTRMGAQKLLLPLDGRPMLQHCLDLIERLPLSHRVLVTTPEVAAQIQTTAQIIINPNPEEGQSGSLRLGVMAANPDHSLLFLLGDQPRLDVETVVQLLAADDGQHIIYPTGPDGVPKSPTLFPPRFRGDLLALTGDTGGRELRRRFPEACSAITVRDPRVLLDIDTPEAYNEIQQQLGDGGAHMYSFFVNDREVQSENGKQNLLTFLRDELKLTGAKNGCDEGACGTCMVIIDGRAVKACIPRVEKLAGKQVTTIEGLSEREKAVYAYAFSLTGAVQCGFCIPGMVISAKALLDSTPDPDEGQVKKAIRGNICRCTGYVKIIEAILEAARLLREGVAVPEQHFTGKLGEDFHRLDAVEKTLGTGIYVDDMTLPDMVYAAALRTKYPRAIVRGIDTARAEAHPDTIRLITAADIPGTNRIGHLTKDQDTLIGIDDVTKYVGDAIVLAVSRRQESLSEILDCIEVTYEELPPVTSPEAGLAEGAPLVQPQMGTNILRDEKLRRGDPDTALQNAAHVVTRRYSLPFTEHAFMEPECAIALPEGEGIHLYSGGQSIYDEQHQIADLLALEADKVHVTSCLVGGGFGGKEDMSCQHHAALAAYLTGLPVKIRFTRQESLIVHPKRHAMEIDMTTGCDETGKLVAMKARIISDTGAFASLGGPVLQRACTHAGGPYQFEHVEVHGTAVYTNNPPAGAFRGFGVTQSAFAMECNLNLLAEMVGISPWEIRHKNAIRPGGVLPNGQIADESTALVECLEAVREVYEASPYTGIASCFKNSGLGVGVPDIGRCIVSVEPDGKAHVRSSAACIGQGMATVLMQMACETLGLSPEEIVIENPDTTRTPDTGTTTASRQTVFAGESAVRACRALKAELDSGKTLNDLIGREFYAEYYPETDPIGSDKPNPVSHVAYGYAAQVVTLDETGKVEKVTAAYDLGRVVNPRAAEGQIEGGIAMGLGYALTEDYPVKDGYPQAVYARLGLFRSTDMPAVDIIFVDGPGRLEAAYGTKGVGELATIPTAPAVQGAYYKLDKVFRQKLPMENTKYRK
ncbi:MAG: selenium-dependent xanthine dehydrogenase [Oscillospiraceae bacterium]|nr:selenium-dependent xanthine dehydrogenase [Oscillospiraceae bacterium]